MMLSARLINALKGNSGNFKLNYETDDGLKTFLVRLLALCQKRSYGNGLLAVGYYRTKHSRTASVLH